MYGSAYVRLALRPGPDQPLDGPGDQGAPSKPMNSCPNVSSTYESLRHRLLLAVLIWICAPCGLKRVHSTLQNLTGISYVNTICMVTFSVLSSLSPMKVFAPKGTPGCHCNACQAPEPGPGIWILLQIIRPVSMFLNVSLTRYIRLWLRLDSRLAYNQSWNDQQFGLCSS